MNFVRVFLSVWLLDYPILLFPPIEESKMYSASQSWNIMAHKKLLELKKCVPFIASENCQLYAVRDGTHCDKYYIVKDGFLEFIDVSSGIVDE